jgi:hypothetical protein
VSQSWRRETAGALAGVLIIAVARPATALSALSRSSGSSAAGISMTIAATSKLRPVTGDVFVYFRTAGDSSATIHGAVAGAASGEVARLYAQQFPFRHPPAAVRGTTVRAGPGTVPFSFTVTPRVAARYQVEVFGTGAAPLARSSRQTVYVSNGEHITGGQPCSRPVCSETFRVYTVLTAAVLGRERAKHCCVYLSVRLSPARQPSRPKWLYLDGQATGSKPRRVSAMTSERTVSFSFRVGNDGYSWLWTPCTKDTEAPPAAPAHPPPASPARMCGRPRSRPGRQCAARLNSSPHQHALASGPMACAV